jgi:VWFA-related protein
LRTEAANAVKDEPSVTASSARAIVLVLDDLHIAATNTPRVTKAVREFLNIAVSAADSIALVFTSGASRGGQDFTSDRRLVLGALDRFRGQKLRSATVERLQDPRLNFGGVVDPNADPNQADRANRARISLDALRRIGEALAKFQDQRPMVLFVSEGPEYEVSGRSTWNRSDQQSINNGIRDAVQSLNRVNATVFAIDPRGVATGNADQIHASSVFETLGVGTSALNGENLRALGVVQAVSANTGGFTMLWRPDMSRDFRRVVAADGSYYLIGYGAPATERGKYHNISVSVRKRGLQVNARTGYFLPASPPAHTEPTRPAN